MAYRKFLDRGSVAVIIITLILFIAAVFVRGLSHDLLLESGVFLVSVKLIIMSYKHAVMSEELFRQLSEMRSALHRLEKLGKGKDTSDA